MLINSFENQTNLAEWFEHRNHYSVVVTSHKDLKRTEYKIQKNDYVYDMLKVKGSVTALVTCAKSLADNFPPTTTTDNKESTKDHYSAATREVDKGVVDSVGEALSQQFKQALAHCPTCLDLPSFMRCKDACSLSKDDPQVSPVGLGV